MMTARFQFQTAALAFAGVFAIAAQARAQFTCTTVAAQGDTIAASAGGGTLGSRFADQVDCNDAGDCLFVAQPLGARDKLFKFPNAGMDEDVAAANGASVAGCSAFRSSNVFRFWSLNNANDVAFRASLVSGKGVFKRPSGGSLEVCAATGFPVDPLMPAEGTFTGLPHVAHVNAGGKVAFVGDRDVAPQRCVFVCDTCSAACPADACTKKVCVGDLTDDGMGGMNEICQIYRAGLGDTDALALAATIGDVDGNPATCPNPKDAILFKTDALPKAKEVAVVGDGCPTPPGGTYTGFAGAGLNEDPNQVAPLVNATDEVGFQAVCNVPSPGNPRTTGIFLWEPAMMTTKALALKGDAAPITGNGTIGNLRRFELSDDDEAIFRTTVGGNTASPRARFCIFRFDTVDEKVVCNNDAPPAPFLKYINIRDPGASSSGDEVCARVRVMDDKNAPGFVPPLVKTAIILCSHP